MQFIEQKTWIAEKFPRDRRFENLVMVGDNVLTADMVRYVRYDSQYMILYMVCSQYARLDGRIREYTSDNNHTLEDLCLRWVFSKVLLLGSN